MISVGIDPGRYGAIAVLRPEDYSVYPMPICVPRPGEHWPDPRALRAVTQPLWMDPEPVPVALELVGGMPGQGARASFSFGRSFGVVWAAFATWQDVTLVTPQTWKAHFGLIGKSKQASLDLAVSMWPGVNLHMMGLKESAIGCAEALLIAEWLRATGGAVPTPRPKKPRKSKKTVDSLF